MTRILDIQPRRQDIRTQTNVDWTDGFRIYCAGPAGVVAGGENVGNGMVTVASVDPLTAIGAYAVTITDIGTLIGLTVSDPGGAVLARGFAGVPLSAGGMVLTVSPGSRAFVVGDAFAVQPTVADIDITGIAWTLEVRASSLSPVVTLAAYSDPPDGSVPTIYTSGPGGVVATLLPSQAMSHTRFPPGSYVYDLVAFADGRRVLAYYGTLTHVDGVTYIL